MNDTLGICTDGLKKEKIFNRSASNMLDGVPEAMADPVLKDNAQSRRWNATEVSGYRSILAVECLY